MTQVYVWNSSASLKYILCFQARGFIAHQTPTAVYAAIYDDELRGKAYVRFQYEV